ncbi:MAG: hypothetical protein K6A14_01475 [Erysipelotrichaceae bacterium]|nr:hypothetical protein [Erysipelotrichaceae bacterium]
MKKLLIALLTMGILFAACGCAKPKEEDLIKKTITDYISDLLSEPMELLSSGGEIINQNDQTKEVWDILNDMLKRTTCVVKEVRIEGEHATADLEFSTYDIGQSFTVMLQEYIDKIMAAYMSEGNWESIDTVAVMTECWKKTLGEQEEKGLTLSFPFTMELEKTAEGWKTGNYLDNEELLNILAGGIFAAYDSDNN